ncbi:MAG: asparagine synthase (glutamine-hydrolyzing) [Chitinispirillaceae bacterium]|nr:asparagine synthase (glutamine-hydrolyzing) [Chitinispirillaceae bacterium]
MQIVVLDHVRNRRLLLFSRRNRSPTAVHGPDDEGFAFIDTNSRRITHFSGSDSYPVIQQRYAPVSTHDAVPHRVALGHRRYAILDLSADGHQPMERDGHVLTFNGEIYNYIELRQELEALGERFSTRSDTEVLLAAFRHWGVQCFAKLNGFFAVVIYDKKNDTLVFARDRVGKAPLYIAHTSDGVFWASEIKSILAAQEQLRPDINQNAVADFIQHGIRDYDNQTFWNGITTFPAASYGVLDASLHMTTQSYWDFPRHRMAIDDISLREAGDGLRDLLMDALKIRLRSDIPVGFSLSGGLDSSTLAALYASSFDRPADCMSITFANKAHSELPYAQQVVDRYRSRLTLHEMRGDDHHLLSEIDQYTHLIEEPYHSPVLYADYYIQKEFKKLGYGVTINGGGGDELLAGYEGEYDKPYFRYLQQQTMTGLFGEMCTPQSLGGIKRRATYLLDTCVVRFRHHASENCRYGGGQSGVSFPNDFSELMIGNFTSLRMNYWMRSGNKSYLGVPVEPRLPFLDYRVIDWCFKLPPQHLIHHGWHKYVLRTAMEPLLPRSIVWRRRKQGFPFDHTWWLQHSRQVLVGEIKKTDMPGIDTRTLIRDYDSLAMKDPVLLWRYISLVLWYRKMILQLSVASG